MKDWFLKTFGELIGTSIAGVLLRVVIALLGLWTGSSTTIGDAAGVAFNKDRAIASAVVLINETPRPEIVEAVKEETAATE